MELDISDSISILLAFLTIGIILSGLGGWNLLKYSRFSILIMGLGLWFFIFAVASVFVIYFWREKPDPIFLVIISALISIICCVIADRIQFGKSFHIDVQDTESKSIFSDQGDEYQFEIVYSLRTNRPSVKIVKLKLHVQDMVMDALNPPSDLDNTSQSYFTIFNSTKGQKLQYPLKAEDKYYLSMFAVGKEQKSKEFKLKRMSVEIQAPTINVNLKAFPPQVEVHKADDKTTTKDS